MWSRTTPFDTMNYCSLRHCSNQPSRSQGTQQVRPQHYPESHACKSASVGTNAVPICLAACLGMVCGSPYTHHCCTCVLGGPTTYYTGPQCPYLAVPPHVTRLCVRTQIVYNQSIKSITSACPLYGMLNYLRLSSQFLSDIASLLIPCISFTSSSSTSWRLPWRLPRLPLPSCWKVNYPTTLTWSPWSQLKVRQLHWMGRWLQKMHSGAFRGQSEGLPNRISQLCSVWGVGSGQIGKSLAQELCLHCPIYLHIQTIVRYTP